MSSSMYKRYHIGDSIDTCEVDVFSAIEDFLFGCDAYTEEKLNSLTNAYCLLVVALEDKGVLSLEEMGLYLTSVEDEQ